MRQITARIEALRPASELEAAIKALRTDLTDIGRSLTEALPRRAVESLEIEIKALAQRIDHSRASGVDATALAGLERGLQDVREALRGLTTAESLVGVDAAVKALAQKVDVIAAKEDPAALQQLETTIGALRGVVSHVASNDTLTKVAEEVRALSAKVDGVANNAASGHALSALESRIDTLATALNASTEAGHAVPRELEKLLAGLIEKLEWVQLTHTDHAALAHLEDRIAMLVKRLDASDARLGQLDGIERGLADLLVHIEQIRGANGKGEAGVKAKSAPGDPIQRDLAEIKQSERRTQDSLEAFQGTVEHVVDRLAMIESDLRGDKATPAAAPAPAATQKMPAAPRLAPPNLSEPVPTAPSAPVAAAPKPVPAEPVHVEPAAPPRVAAARPPIDPNLPPDHPLEPGSAAGRSRPMPAAERTPAAQGRDRLHEFQAAGHPGSRRQTRLHRRRTPRGAGRRRGFAPRPVERQDRRQGSIATRQSDAASAQVDRGRGGRGHHRRRSAHRLAAVRGRRHWRTPGAADRVGRIRRHRRLRRRRSLPPRQLHRRRDPR